MDTLKFKPQHGTIDQQLGEQLNGLEGRRVFRAADVSKKSQHSILRLMADEFKTWWGSSDTVPWWERTAWHAWNFQKTRREGIEEAARNVQFLGENIAEGVVPAIVARCKNFSELDLLVKHLKVHEGELGTAKERTLEALLFMNSKKENPKQLLREYDRALGMEKKEKPAVEKPAVRESSEKKLLDGLADCLQDKHLGEIMSDGWEKSCSVFFEGKNLKGAQAVSRAVATLGNQTTMNNGDIAEMLRGAKDVNDFLEKARDRLK